MERGKLPEIPVPAWPQTATARLTNHPLSNREFLEVPEYLKTPPSVNELTKILDLLAMAPRQLMRRGEKIYKEQGLNDDSLSDKKLVAAMVADPILIERPIVLANGKAALGRPPESVTDIL